MVQTKLTEEVISNPWIGFAEFDVSGGAPLVSRAGRTENRFTITWLDRAGKSEPVGIEPGAYFTPRLSPDGSRIVYWLQGPTSDLWIYDWQRDSKTRLTSGRMAFFPVWSRDGRFVVFQAAGGMFWTRRTAWVKLMF